MNVLCPPTMDYILHAMSLMFVRAMIQLHVNLLILVSTISVL